MANKPFDREVFNAREKLVSGDFNLTQTTSDLALREFISSSFSGRDGFSDAIEGAFDTRFVADSFKVGKSFVAPPMGVFVRNGIGFAKLSGDNASNIDGILGLNDNSPLKPVVLSEDQQFTVPANPSGDTRVDIIEVKYDRQVGDSQSRQVLDQATGGFQTSPVNKTFGWGLDGLTGTVAAPSASTQPLSYKQGIPGAGAPSTTTGYTKISEIYVPAGASGIATDNIADTRKQLLPNNSTTISAQILLPNVNSSSGFVSVYKPQVISFSGPPGIQFSCYPVDATKLYEFVLVGNFANVTANVCAADDFPISLLNQTPLAAGVRILSSGIVQALTRADTMKDSVFADPVVEVPGEQKCAFVRFAPYQIFLDGSTVCYKRKIDSTGANPLLVNLIAVLSY